MDKKKEKVEHTCKMESPLSSYMKLRILISVPDMLTDCVQGFRLIHEGHVLWGLLLLLWIVVPCLASLGYVVTQKIRKQRSLTGMKYLLLVMTTHISICQPLFESGPQLVSQGAVFWSGVHQHQEIDFSHPGNLFWVLFDIISIFLSFTSLVFTATKFNRESGTSRRTFFLIFSLTSSLLFRLFVFSILIYTNPLPSFIALALICAINIGLYYHLDKNVSCLLHAYFFLYLPIGHNRATKFKDCKIQPKTCESENIQLDKENQITRIIKIFSINLLQNYALLIFFFVVYEELTLPYSDIYNYSPILVSRQLIYNSSYPIIFLVTLFSYMYYTEARKSSSTPSPDSDTLTGLVDHQTISTSPGNQKCGSADCPSCSRLEEGPCFFSSETRRHYNIMEQVDCNYSDIIYLITCKQCRKQYVGQTERSLKAQTSLHIAQMNMQDSVLGKHFGSECGTESWRIQIIEKCSVGSLADRRYFWQQELLTVVPHGLNNIS